MMVFWICVCMTKNLVLSGLECVYSKMNLICHSNFTPL
jgi:hypothetical protein